MIRQDLNYCHLSGKWDIDQDQFADGVERLRNWGADIIALTEMGEDEKGDILRGRVVPSGFAATPEHWGVIAPRDNDRGENAVHWDKRQLSYVNHKVYPLTTLRVKTRDGHLRPPVVLLKVILKDKTTGRQIIVCVVHMVSGVETDLAQLLAAGKVKNLTCPTAPWRVQVWLSGLRGLRSRMRKIRFWHPNSVVLLSGDFNVNLERDNFRELVQEAVGMRLGGYWDNVKGTFKDSGRRIDALFITGPDASVGAVEHGRLPGFDHHWLRFPVYVIKRT